MTKNKLVLALGAPAVAALLLVGSTAFAQTPPSTGTGTHMGYGSYHGQGTQGGRPMMNGMGGAGMKPAVFGTVASISGDTLTITSKGFGTTTAAAAVKTYTVDATNATVFKNNATSSLSVVAVGDTVVVQGTISGTSVTATTIRDGVVPMGGMRGGMGGGPKGGPTIEGNGQPIVGGTVASVSGSTITITTAKGGITYTVDATNAVVGKDNATSSVSSIVVGDNVTVQGAVNGTSVTASTVIDQGAPHAPSTGSTTSSMWTKVPVVGSVLGAVGGFFQHLFGFF